VYLKFKKNLLANKLIELIDYGKLVYMRRRRLYSATLRARRTKRLDKRHEIARDRDRDETLLVFETVSRPRHIPGRNPGELTVKGSALAVGIPGCAHAPHLLMTASTYTFYSAKLALRYTMMDVISVIKWRLSRLHKAAASSELGADFE